jgi:hypothetical protein
MRTQSPDTSPEMERVQIDMLRKMSISERFALIESWSQFIREVAKQGIRRDYPHIGEEAVTLMLADRLYGHFLSRKDLCRFSIQKKTMNIEGIITAIIPIVASFERRGIDYYIGGSVVSSTYGIPRATFDVDLVADLRAEHVHPLVKELEAEYYIDEDMIRDAIEHRSSFNIMYLVSMLKVDVFLPKLRPFDQEEYRRIRSEALIQGTRPFYVASPEDTVLHKLEWYRMGNEVSDRQWNDILGVLKIQGKTIDMAYLKHWAIQLRVTDLLDRVLEDAGLTESS